MAVIVEDMQPADWPAVRKIYAEGIATGNATFETEVATWPEWDSGHLTLPRLVARQDGEIVAWAALSRTSGRIVYAGVAEVSLYVAQIARGQGIGRMILTDLIEGSERLGFWTLQAGIFPQNVASLRLHQACGFREVGRRERIGQLHGVWRDTVLLERRSPAVGL